MQHATPASRLLCMSWDRQAPVGRWEMVTLHLVVVLLIGAAIGLWTARELVGLSAAARRDRKPENFAR